MSSPVSRRLCFEAIVLRVQRIVIPGPSRSYKSGIHVLAGQLREEVNKFVKYQFYNTCSAGVCLSGCSAGIFCEEKHLQQDA